MKKLFFGVLMLISINTFALPYYMSQSGTAHMNWNSPGSATILCVYSPATCWGIAKDLDQDRWYIDVIGYGSWWLDIMVNPIQEDENKWTVNHIGPPK